MRLDIRPAMLNEVAAHLAYERDQSPGRPSNARLRRSVSSAYYALFHAIALAVVEHVLPQGGLDERLGLTRSIDHSAIAQVCQLMVGEIRAPEHAEATVLQARASQDVMDIATIFPQLQEARFGADYDHHWEITKAAALSWVQLSRAAIERLGRLTSARSAEVQAFLGLIALRTPKIR